VEGTPENVFIGLYAEGQTDLRCYESSLICHDRVSATSVFVAPFIPGTYTIMLIRDEEVLTKKNLTVVAALEGGRASTGWHGSFVHDPEAPFENSCCNMESYDSLKSAMSARAKGPDGDGGITFP